MPQIPIIGSQYTSRSLAADAQSCVNLIVENLELSVVPAAGVGTAIQGKGKAALYGAPGRHLLVALPSGDVTVKGLWSGGGRLFVALGKKLYEVKEGGSWYTAGAYTAVETGQPVPMFVNGNQLTLIGNDTFVY